MKDTKDNRTPDMLAKRGPGRPRSPSKMVRVPLGCVGQVKAVIDAYRASQKALGNSGT